MLVRMNNSSIGGDSDSGTFIYPTSAETVTIPVKIKASIISIIIIKDSTKIGTSGCDFNSDGSQNNSWYGDSYDGGRFAIPSYLTFVRNSDNSISITSPGSNYLGGSTVEWLACE